MGLEEAHNYFLKDSVVEAIRWDGNAETANTFCGYGVWEWHRDTWSIYPDKEYKSLSSKARVGDYIAKDSKGHVVRVIKAEEFEKKYQMV